MRRRYVIALDAFLIASAGAMLAGAMALWGEESGLALRTIRVGTIPYGISAPDAIGVDEQTGRAFVVDSNSGWISTLDTHDGAVLNSVDGGGGDNPLSPLVDGRSGHVFVANASSSGNNRVAMLDARTGTLLHVGAVPWTPDGQHMALDPQRGRLFLATGRVLDTRSGAASATFAAGGDRLALDDRSGRVFALMYDLLLFKGTGAGVRMLDGHGTMHWIAPIGAPHAVAVDGQTGRVFVTGSVGTTVLDARDGQPHVQAMAIDERRRRVVVTSLGPTTPIFGANTSTGPGTVSVLDADSGALLRTARVGVNPVAVAVDGQTGHIFVVNMGGNVHPSDSWGWWPSWLPRPPFVPAPPPPVTVVPGSVSMLGV